MFETHKKKFNSFMYYKRYKYILNTSFFTHILTVIGKLYFLRFYHCYYYSPTSHRDTMQAYSHILSSLLHLF
jgi:hypothetical protein